MNARTVYGITTDYHVNEVSLIERQIRDRTAQPHILVLKVVGLTAAFGSIRRV